MATKTKEQKKAERAQAERARRLKSLRDELKAEKEASDNLARANLDLHRKSETSEKRADELNSQVNRWISETSTARSERDAARAEVVQLRKVLDATRTELKSALWQLTSQKIEQDVKKAA